MNPYGEGFGLRQSLPALPGRERRKPKGGPASRRSAWKSTCNEASLAGAARLRDYEVPKHGEDSKRKSPIYRRIVHAHADRQLSPICHLDRVHMAWIPPEEFLLPVGP